MKSPPLIVIAGPTGSGKNDIAIKLAEKYNGIIINSDSRQIYKDLNIGTAKPIPEKIKKDGVWYISNIPHYLYGFASLDTNYNIYRYKKDVEKIVNENKRVPIFFVGGTGLYIDSVIYNYNLPKTNNSNYSSFSMKQLQELIKTKNIELSNSEINNRRRLETILKREKNPEMKQPVKHLYLVIDIDKEELKKRVQMRIDKMFENGLLEENRLLFNKYKSYTLQSLQTIGYREFEDYFNKKIKLAEVKNLINIHTNQYIKRQRTWFKRNKDVIYVKNYEEANLEVEKFLITFN